MYIYKSQFTWPHFFSIFWDLLQNHELTYEYFKLFLLELLHSLSLSKQGTYGYTGPDSHLHHDPITKRGQEAGVSCKKFCL